MDEGGLSVTPILDFDGEAVQALADRLERGRSQGRPYLRRCHKWIEREIRPVYTVDERQPASRTLEKGRGSCSQRLALLEALARASGIPTQVRAYWVKGTFWKPRFPLTSVFIPRRVLVLWPEFRLQAWLGVEEVFGDLVQLAQHGPGRFSNAAETLFEAVSRTAVDFRGRTRLCQGSAGQCDLSGFVESEAGTFPSRDLALLQLGSFQDTFRGRCFEFIYGGRKSR